MQQQQQQQLDTKNPTTMLQRACNTKPNGPKPIPNSADRSHPLPHETLILVKQQRSRRTNYEKRIKGKYKLKNFKHTSIFFQQL